MSFQFVSYIWVLLASTVVMTALGIYAWRHRAGPGATPFAGLMLVAVVWALTNGLEMVGTDLSTKLFWANVQYLCYVTLPVAGTSRCRAAMGWPPRARSRRRCRISGS